MRIGVIGAGLIGRAAARLVTEHPGLELAFLYSRSGRQTGPADDGLTVQRGTPNSSELKRTDLVVEAAHPSVIVGHGEEILAHCDLIATSVGALADPHVLNTLVRSAEVNARSLIVPQGALVGLDSILAQHWTSAQITMVKAPEHLDPRPQGIVNPTVLHLGPVGALVARYPRNVNAMVAFALATLGLERTMAKLVCDPGAKEAQLQLDLSGPEGSLHIAKEQRIVGVSGTEMPASILRTITTVAGVTSPGLRFL